MRKTSLTVIAVLVALTVTVPVMADAVNPQKPGKWQVKMQMDMPGLPIKLPPVTFDVCLTEEDLKDPQKSVPTDPKAKCTVSDYKIDGDTVTWNVDCPKQDMKGRGEITYTDDSYSGTMKMTTGDQEMSTKYSGKWLGTCTK
jgi:hypothetical protein